MLRMLPKKFQPLLHPIIIFFKKDEKIKYLSRMSRFTRDEAIRYIAKFAKQI
jgi:hypothetical protein